MRLVADALPYRGLKHKRYKKLIMAFNFNGNRTQFHNYQHGTLQGDSHLQRSGSGHTLVMLSFNAQRSKAASTMIIKIVDEQAADLVCIQEPYLINNQIVRFGGWKVFPHRNFCTTIKTGILIRNPNIKANFCTDLSTALVTTVLLSLQDKDIYLSSVYCSPFQEIEELLDDLQDIDVKIGSKHWVICGDFNSKSSIWHSLINDDRGHKVCDFIFAKQMVSCNTSPLATYSCTRGESWVNLVLASDSAQHLIHECYTIDENGGSDHRFIKISIKHNDNTLSLCLTMPIRSLFTMRPLNQKFCTQSRCGERPWITYT
ncbi:uncharacterized protein LOC111634924 [Centruroides sculpturatus]|uniref:uncharacterized protein LOC111630769 n=1 Tax=Centruroides sculpturatus TaxID=218467 RepID=UPI000C6E804D|nr:uncharacterized protein LOC111630769 [Centruroides sculpturatus]XP_023235526.1 uncharacterized protein LOC111634924 [Centruroides sculpturatus]